MGNWHYILHEGQSVTWTKGRIQKVCKEGEGALWVILDQIWTQVHFDEIQTRKIISGTTQVHFDEIQVQKIISGYDPVNFDKIQA